MNITGLRPWQPQHMAQLITALLRKGTALDASDTGTGKTYVALAICRELGVAPVVIGPKNSRKTWEDAAQAMGVEIEWINYEKVRGRRSHRGGTEIDSISIRENRDRILEAPCFVVAYRNGKSVFQRACDWSEAAGYTSEAGVTAPYYEFGDYTLETPRCINQQYTAESDWVEEVKYGSGSYIKWKNAYTVMIFDEVHRCGGSTTLNSKLLIAAKRQAKYILALSATAADDPRQMKALGFALGLHKLSDKKFGFRNWLFKHGCTLDEHEQLTFTMSDVRRKQTFEQLNAEIFPSRGSRMRKSEIPDFPHTQILVKLLSDESGRAAKLTADLKEKYELYKELAKVDSEYTRKRQALELLMVPDACDLALDLVGQRPTAIFVNYTDTLDEIVQYLGKHLGNKNVGWITGDQTGAEGERQRNEFVSRFQSNDLPVIVGNVQAAGESLSLHDPTGKVGRATEIFPCDSGRRLKQIFGRVDRAGGADSIQYLLYFAGTTQEDTAKRVMKRVENIELLNDADLI